jgi:nucleotide-binding universal stress UspA family protein
MFDHILLATDGTEVSERATSAAIELAKKLGARITALYVMPPQPFLPGDATLALEEVVAFAKEEGVEVATAIESGEPWDAIIKVALSARPDIIALAPHGGETEANAVIDGDTTRVVLNTRVPVMLCR